ncbi:hypothetical protein ESA94_05265 [Lacibacter luteus]|uniref:Uncharacterized protein n=1 Tax=Lacibacter luteus TaxID=2508719 RepID=A0A4Q1CP55_9BACT|nr:hypothetical protein [Lacibacter luteus]RXK62419.1 hypothetical protein ESA94_05265 [Lacibacter luteus]
MQLRAFFFLFFIAFVLSAIAGDYTGVWEGYFYLRSKKHKINVRIEVIQKENWVRAVIATRGYENNTTYGCEYSVHGWFENNNLTLAKENVKDAFAITSNDCGSFKHIKLSLNLKDSTNTAKGRWVWADDSEEVFVIKRMNTAVSESAKEEINEVSRTKYITIGNQKPIKQSYVPDTKKIGQLKVDYRKIVITVSSVIKDTTASLSAWVNGKALVKDFNLASSDLIIKLEEITPVNRLIFLNSSDTGKQLDVKISFQQGMKRKVWVTAIEALGDVLLELIYNDDLYRDEFSGFGQDQL